MKAIKRTLFAMLLALPFFASAQSVEIDEDSLNLYYSPCPVPVNGTLPISGSATNFNSATDSIEVQVYWGDGTFDIDTVQLYESGTTDYWYNYVQHVYSFTGTYQVLIIATAPGGIADTVNLPSPVTVAAYCVDYDGHAYKDLNTNCILESSDDTIGGKTVIVEDASGNFLAYDWIPHSYYWSNSWASPNFSITLPNGLTNLTIYAYDYYGESVVCPSGGAYNFSVLSPQTFDFAFDCVQNTYDKRLYANSYIAPPGDTGWIYLNTYAYHCDTTVTIDDTVTLVLDPNVHYLGTQYGPSPNQINGNVLTWYTSLTQYNNWSTGSFGPYIFIDVITDTSLSLYDTVCLEAMSNITGQEMLIFNNDRNWCPEVGVSYDPNNKLVFPQGEGPLGKIDTSVNSLTYIINFQNTGTAPAQHVYLIDSLSTHLDMKTFRVEEASHAYDVTFQKNRRIRFDFPNINLIDSATNEAESKGFIMFSIDIADGTPVGTQIQNGAGIYFDYNEPIITNTVTNTIYIAPEEPNEPDSLVAMLHKRDITCMDNDNGRLEVSVISGMPPYTYAWSTGSANNKISKLSAGTFTVTITDNEGQQLVLTETLVENRIHESPTVGEITGVGAAQAWESFYYSIEATPNSTYDWDALGGEVMDFAGNQAEIRWFGGLVGTVIAYRFDEHGCMGENSRDFPILFVGQEEVRINNLSLFPNPAKDNLYLQGLEEGKAMTLRLYDNAGRMVVEESINSSTAAIPVEGLATGSYIVRLTDGDQVIGSAMIVKE